MGVARALRCSTDGRVNASRRSLAAVLAAVALVSAGCGSREIKGNGDQAAAPAAAQPSTPGSDLSAASPAPAESPAGTPAAPDGAATAGAVNPSGTSAGTPSVNQSPGAANGGGSPAATTPRSATAQATAAAQSPGAKPGAEPSRSGGAAPAPGAPGKPGPAPAAPAVPGSAGCSPITIGTVGTFSGVVGQAMAGVGKAVQAWVTATNARGGLNCRQIKYFLEDDGADPNRHRAVVQKFVEERGVIAFVGNNAPFSGFSSIDYINQKKIPVVGGGGVEPWYYGKSPYFFPQASGGDLMTSVAMGSAQILAKPQGKTKVGVIACIETQICGTANDLAPKVAAEYGLEVVYRGRASITQPDYTSICLSAQSAGVEILYTVVDGNTTHRVAKSCTSVGFKPTYLSPLVGIQDDYKGDPNLDGAIGGFNILPWFYRDGPGIKEYQDTLRQFAPDLPFTTSTVTGWTASKLFELVAKNLPEPPTSQAILQSLWKVKNNDLGGLTHPLTFTEGQTAPEVVCYWPVVVQGGRWSSPTNGQRTCR